MSRNNAYRLHREAKRRSKENGLPFDLDRRDIVVPVVCPILGIPLSRGPNGGHDGSPTLDRIDSSLGYVKGNVVVISMRANRIKNNATPEELRRIADWCELRAVV